MNDLELLDTYGPGAGALEAETRNGARARLLAEAARENLSPLVARRRTPRRRFAAVGVAAASIVGAAVLLPSIVGLNSSGAIALAPAAPLTFPLTPEDVPANLTDTIFEMDTGFKAARYVGSDGNQLTVMVDLDDRDRMDIPEEHRSVDVAGHPGMLFDGMAYHGTVAGTPSVSVVWQDDGGSWVRVSGEGAFAKAASVEAFAESLRERPQRVNLSLRVAPRGWSVAAYKEDRVVRLTPDGGPSDVDLGVSLVDEPSEDFAADYGAGNVTDADIHGRTALVAETAGGWAVLARTSRGQAYFVDAPASFTRQQVVEVARGVTYRP